MNLYWISKKETLRKPLTQRCIILDIDETLVHSSEDYLQLMRLRPFNDPAMLDLRPRMYNLSLNGYNKPPNVWGITRPHVEEFLLFCIGYFSKVCIWSAGIPEYVRQIVDLIFPIGFKPDAVYNRSHCHYAQNGELFKPIEKMAHDEGWEKILRLDNTFFVDDRPQVFFKNPDNGILIPPYEPSGSYYNYIQDDPTLPELMEWLMKPEVLQAKDVRLLDKSRIFSRSRYRTQP
jgi:TFIIF-interacting CTD phosphatase-like protein